jgi:hypothetical protein
MGVYVLTSCNRLAGKADDLVVAAHGIACVQRLGGYFVARGDQAFGGDVFYFCAGDELCACYDDVVCGMESYKRCHGVRFLNSGCSWVLLLADEAGVGSYANVPRAA